MKLKKLLAAGLALALTASLAACTTPTATNTPAPATPAPNTNTEQPSTGAATEITLWTYPIGNWGTEATVKELTDAFTAETGIKVTVEYLAYADGDDKVNAAITAGKAPDLVMEGPERLVANWGAGGHMVDLSDMLDDTDRSEIQASVLNACTASTGAVYEYPLVMTAHCMAINLDAFKEAGADQYVDLTTHTWTTEQFTKAIAALNAKFGDNIGAVYCTGQGGDQGTRALVANLYSSAGYVGADGKWNIDEGGVKALKLLQDMYNKKSIDAGFDMAAADELQKFQQETAAMTICFGTSAEVTYKSDSYTQVAVPFPSDDGKPSLEYLVNGFCVFNNKDDARAAAAKAFIQFICDDPTYGPKSVVATNAFPVRSSFGDLYPGDAEKSLLASWTKYYGPYYNTQPNFAVMRTEWWNMLQRIFGGGDVAKEVAVFNKQANEAPAAK